MSLYGTILAGGVAVGIYLTNSADACLYILKHSRANIVVIDGEHQLQKILAIRKELPHLKAIIQYGEKPTNEDVFAWEDILKIGESVPDDILNRRIKNLAINQCCSIIYTSGTTGTPKAVMLSHDNMVYVYASLLEHNLHFFTAHENARVISYLPLNHVAGQLMDTCNAVLIGAQLHFAQPDAFKGSLGTTLKEVCPTVFVGVPRVYDKMKEQLEEKLTSSNWIYRLIITWAMNCVRTFTKSQLSKNPYKPFGYTIANRIVDGIKERMGLRKTMYFGSGGAPFLYETTNFFMGLGIIIIECYGMSETAGGHSWNNTLSYRFKSVGKKNELNETKIHEPSPEGEGEILMRGRNIFMGYMFDEEKTKETITEDGWVHSGDIGKIDEDGHLYVTGRIKELIITAGGENIAPYPIEEAVKAELPIISQAIVVGDKQKYLSMLITLNVNTDPETQEPLKTLSEVSVSWCQSVGSNAKTIDDIIQGDTKVMAAIQDGINRANKKAVSNACRVQKWKILPQDLTLQNDELGPTLKVKRYVVHKRYSDIINSMYA